MRVAVISDCHGDVVALSAVVADLDRRAVDQVVVAGDVAQGGPEPAEVMDLLVSRGWPMVIGNSDEFLLDVAARRPVKEAVPEAAMERGRWSVEQLGAERLALFEGLPVAVRVDLLPGRELVVVHATPWSTHEVVLADAGEEVAERMVAGAWVVAHGHIHSAYQRRVGGSVLMSVGAMSGSNDVDPRPAYTIIEVGDGQRGRDTDEGDEIEVEVVRVECSRMPRSGPWPVRATGVLRVWP